MRMKKVGILGGTFNPIHVGHLLLGDFVREELALQEIWFVPTGQSYMKDEQYILPAKERLHMVELAVKGNENFVCRDIEAKRSGKSYSYETLLQLKREYPDHEFYFIAGADCLFEIEEWKFPELIFDNCILVVATRENAIMEEMRVKREALCKKYGARIQLLSFMNISVSSTLIRNRILQGKSVRYMLPEKVLKYIEEKEFYRDLQ